LTKREAHESLLASNNPKRTEAGAMASINAVWHRAHPMPKNPTIDQRIAWHLDHARNCGCRKTSGKLLEEMTKRGIRIPRLKA